jgi:hypothetical protein
VASLTLRSSGFACIKDYLARRFEQDALQRFMDDPQKHKGSIRDALEVLLRETAPDAFSLTDYARIFAATDTDAHAALDGAIAAPGLFLCRVQFASDQGLAKVQEVCAAERDWMSDGDGDPCTRYDRNLVCLSPLLTTCAVLARFKARAKPSKFADLSAGYFCFDANAMIDRPYPRAQRVGALMLQVVA